MSQENKQGVWGQFFAQGYSPKEYQQLRLRAQKLSNYFMKDVYAGIIPVQDDLTPYSADAELDNWVESPIGQNKLAALVEDIQTHIASVAEFALPAHDSRQILFKDAAEALRFADMEKPQGYKAAFVIPTFCHDIGRLLEGRFFHEDNLHDDWIPHAQLSFLMLKEILDKPDYADIPEKLKSHFLYAVLAHSGGNGQSYMSRAVQTCDRMQLIGAEGFFRALSYGICLMDADIKYPEDESYNTDLPDMLEHRSVISMMEFFSRNMRENIGDAHTQWQDRIAVENVALLMKVSEREQNLFSRIFAPELRLGIGYSERKNPIPDKVMTAAQIIYNQYDNQNTTAISAYDVTEEIEKALSSPLGVAQISPPMKTSLMRSVLGLTNEGRNALYDTVMMADRLRAEQDALDKNVLMTMAQSGQSFERQIASKSMEYAPPVLSQNAKAMPSSLASLFAYRELV